VQCTRYIVVRGGRNKLWPLQNAPETISSCGVRVLVRGVTHVGVPAIGPFSGCVGDRYSSRQSLFDMLLSGCASTMNCRSTDRVGSLFSRFDNELSVYR
jgi:hypothetical protein